VAFDPTIAWRNLLSTAARSRSSCQSDVMESTGGVNSTG
jgi:hypothetical protein